MSMPLKSASSNATQATLCLILEAFVPGFLLPRCTFTVPSFPAPEDSKRTARPLKAGELCLHVSSSLLQPVVHVTCPTSRNNKEIGAFLPTRHSCPGEGCLKTLQHR